MRRFNKYRNEPVTVDGHRFQSKREARRYAELKTLEKAGTISNLELQPRFPISVNGVHVCAYYADFCYVDSQGRRIVEDAKGLKTPVYRLKKRLVEALYEIVIQEV
jgi:hypothetical protein